MGISVIHLIHKVSVTIRTRVHAHIHWNKSRVREYQSVQ